MIYDLFVVPHYSLSQEIEGEATAYDMFLRIPVDQGDGLPEFDHSKFDVIFFDYIFVCLTTKRYSMCFQYEHEGS